MRAGLLVLIAVETVLISTARALVCAPVHPQGVRTRTPMPIMAALEPPSAIGTSYLTARGVKATLVRSAPGMQTHTVAEAAIALGVCESRVIKTLVCVANDGLPLRVLLCGADRVDLRALSSHVGCRARLATPAEALAATGHEVGVIPPFSAAECATVRTLMDEKVLAQEGTVYAGSGEDGVHLCIAAAELGRATDAQLGRFAATAAATVVAAATMPVAAATTPVAAAATPAAPPPPPPPPAPAARVDETRRGAALAAQLDERPGGASVRPLSAEVGAALAASAPLFGLDVELPLAEVLRVRRQARLLVFASLRMLQPPRLATETAAAALRAPSYGPDGRPYAPRPDERTGAPAARSPPSLESAFDKRTKRPTNTFVADSADEVASRAAAASERAPVAAERLPAGWVGADTWQLLAGKTLTAELGEAEALERMRRLKPGQLVRVRGRPQLNPREGNGPDIVAHALEIVVSPLEVAGEAALAIEAAEPVAEGDAVGDTAVAWAADGRPSAAAAAADELPPCECPTPTLVDDARGVAALEAMVEAAVGTGTVVGVDAEWRPRRYELEAVGGAASAPLSLLQLATREGVWVVDVLALSETEALRGALERCLHRLLAGASAGAQDGAQVLGFAMDDDFARLARALPGALPGVDGSLDAALDAALDLQPLATAALGRSARRVVGLQAAAASFLGERLDKSLQVRGCH